MQRTKEDHIPLLSELEEQVLHALHIFHYLTLDQYVLYLGKSINSKNYVGNVLKKLTKNHSLLERIVLPRIDEGRPPFIYKLSSKGKKHLAELGYDVTPDFNLSSFLFLTHTLRVNDVLLSAFQLQKEVAGITLADFKHELVLKRTPTKILLSPGTTVSVIPDLWLRFAFSPPFGEGDDVAVIVELDRNTVDKYPFQTKIRNLCLFLGDSSATSPYVQAFGTDTVFIAWAVAEGGEKRVTQLRQWTLEELTRLQQLTKVDHFLFSALPPGNVASQQFFLSPVWHTLDTNTMVALIE